MAKEKISDANVENIVRFMLAGVSNMTAASSEYFINMTVVYQFTIVYLFETISFFSSNERKQRGTGS